MNILKENLFHASNLPLSLDQSAQDPKIFEHLSIQHCKIQFVIKTLYDKWNGFEQFSIVLFDSLLL